MFLLFMIIVPALMLVLATNFIFVLAWLCCLPWHVHVAYRPFAYVAIALVTVWAVLLLYGNLVGRFRSQTRELEFRHADVPEAFDGYRIVHVSDIHLDSWKGHEQQLRKRIDYVNGLHPDLVCFTGDLVSLSADELPQFCDILRGLKATDGVVSVMGNHDYLPYSRRSDRQRADDVAELQRMEREELGWNLLLNENALIRRGADSLAVLGCENQSVGAHPVVQRGDLAKAAAGTEGMMRILLSHDPSQWRKEVLGATDIPLMLSGHTHAMQFRFLGWTPSRWIYPECDGLYTEGSQSLYVNIGLGGTAPFRIGAAPEITLITLRRR